jgi:hypothetical protein
MDSKADISSRVMGRGIISRRRMDQDIMMIGGVGVLDLWRRVWRVWPAVVVWMLVCYSSGLVLAYGG